LNSSPRPHDVIFFASPSELRDWLDANHTTADELWIGYHKKHTGRPSVTWQDVVDEALRVGWIDGVRYSLGDDRGAQRITPRRKGSNWSARNVAIARRLIDEGEMLPAGLAAFEARTPERTAVYSYERDSAALTDEESARLRADAAARADWERRPPSYRRAVTYWLVSAKRPETRTRRFEMLLADAAAGRQVAPLRDRPGPAAKSTKATKGTKPGK
jgi:uncharacterized protein YdeI (YjbR/CyaY-like superfamily)